MAARKSDNREIPENVAQNETQEVVNETIVNESEGQTPIAPVVAPQVEQPKEAPATKAPAVPVQAPKVKKVKVILTQDIDSLINGVRYSYPARKMIEVPEDVAQILVHGNKGYRM